MAELGSLLDTGDKVASIVGAVAGLAALWVAVRAGTRRHRRRGSDARFAALLAAQLADASRHRYRFFGEHVPALTDLYVRSRATLGGPTEGDKPRTVQATQILTAHRHAVLLGDAGAGKSTFLATVAADLAGRVRNRRGRGDIAVIVPAADLVGRRLPDALARAVRRDLAVDLPPEVFDRSPAGGAWRVLVDGLDEVVAAQDRSEVLWRIKGMLAEPGPYRFVLTCRPLSAPELAELRGHSVGVYDLRSFDRRELDEFAHRWFAARFPDDRRRADRTAGRFLARVAGARLGPVARVPLLATIAALVYESADDRALPSSRAALYDRFVDHLLDGRSSLDRFREAVEPDLLSRGTEGAAVATWLCSDIRRHVGGLLRACGAAWMTDSEVRLMAVAAGWIDANAPYDLGPDRDRLLRELLLTTGVCTLRRDQVVFAHQSFAEYFAAAAGDAAFDEKTWAAQAVDPGTRSLAAFAAARRPESDTLIGGLLTRDEPNAAGDLLADGIAVRAETRDRIIALLLRQVSDEAEQAPEALRVLGELSVDGDVLARMSALATDPELSSWTRALVADRIADIDPISGHELLRNVAEHSDGVVRAWIADTLHDRGGQVDPDMRLPLAADAVPVEKRPLGALARQALTQRLADARATETERVAAAHQLAEGGDLTPLRAMAEAADVDPYQRVQLAGVLADAGDPSVLRRLGPGSAGTSQAAYAAARALFERDDPAAGPALRAVAGAYPDRPMAYAAAARCVELGDREPLIRLAREPGEVHVRLAAARRLAALGNVQALSWLLEDRQVPALEAATLAGLLEAGRTEAVPRLEQLLRRHRFRMYQRVELRRLLAANGHRQSQQILRRLARRRIGSSVSLEAATALTALDDPLGPDRLRRTAASRGLRQRSRMRAAVGLAQLEPISGRQMLDRLAAPGSPPALRLRAATVALGILDSTDALARLALEETAPAGKRADAIELLVDRDDSALLARLASLATTSTTPALVRAAAAPVLPGADARSVLISIAGSGAHPTARVAAIDKLDSIDSRAATELFGRLLRDRRIGRLRRWALATDSDLLSAVDASTIADRLGDPDDGLVRWARNLVLLAIRRPERVLSSSSD
jgi:NACHT domain